MPLRCFIPQDQFQDRQSVERHNRYLGSTMATEIFHSCNTIYSLMTNSTSRMSESIGKVKVLILVGFENDDELPVANLPLACAGWFLVA